MPTRWCELVWLALCLVALWLALNLPRRWRWRRWPGPWPLPLLGNLPSIIRHDITRYLQLQARRHGPVFKVWVGSWPMLIISDPDMGRKVAFRFGRTDAEQSQYVAFSTTLGESRQVEQAMTFMALGEQWRRGRRAFDHFLANSARLAEHLPPMCKAVDRWVARVDGAADSGAPLDMFRQFGDLTLAVIGEVGFGVDFGTLEGDIGASSTQALMATPYDELPQGRQLSKACLELFDSLLFTKTTRYFLAQLALPDLYPFWRWAEAVLPDRGQRSIITCRNKIAELCKQLMARWQALPPEARAADRSFMGALMQERRLASSSERLTDIEVIANAFLFILAGYETTATSLAYVLHLLSTHPEAQAVLCGEVDAWLKEQGGQLRVESIDKGLPYMDAVLKEASRVYVVVPQQLRTVPRGVALELNGMTVPTPCFVMSATHNYCHDAKFFPQPDAFLPARFLPPMHPDHLTGMLPPPDVLANVHLPFGSGPRMCPGHRFPRWRSN